MDSKYTIVTPVRETGQNINSYRIYVSNDAKNWELLVDETGREKDDVKSDFIAPVKARYIKLNHTLNQV